MVDYASLWADMPDKTLHFSSGPLIKNDGTTPVLDSEGNPVVGYTALPAEDTAIQSGFDALSALTVVAPRPNTTFTQSGLATELGFSRASSFRAGLDAAVSAGDLPGWVITLLDSDGIDVTNADVAGTLSALVAAGHVIQTDVDAVLALANTFEYKYPHLKMGDVATARRQARDGVV